MSCLDPLLTELEAELGCRIPPVLVPRELDWREVGDPWFRQAGKAPLLEFLIQYRLAELATLATDGHGIAGLWGHGVNSYAFYLGHRRGNSFLHLRLPFGGVYSDLERQRHRIHGFLPAAAACLERHAGAGDFVLLQSIDQGLLHYRRDDGSIEERRADFLAASERLAG